jgi:hypothetical protein
MLMEKIWWDEITHIFRWLVKHNLLQCTDGHSRFAVVEKKQNESIDSIVSFVLP